MTVHNHGPHAPGVQCNEYAVDGVLRGTCLGLDRELLAARARAWVEKCRVARLQDQSVEWEDSEGHHVGVVTRTYLRTGAVEIATPEGSRFVRAVKVRPAVGIATL